LGRVKSRRGVILLSEELANESKDFFYAGPDAWQQPDG